MSNPASSPADHRILFIVRCDKHHGVLACNIPTTIPVTTTPSEMALLHSDFVTLSYDAVMHDVEVRRATSLVVRWRATSYVVVIVHCRMEA